MKETFSFFVFFDEDNIFIKLIKSGHIEEHVFYRKESTNSASVIYKGFSRIQALQNKVATHLGTVVSVITRCLISLIFCSLPSLECNGKMFSMNLVNLFSYCCLIQMHSCWPELSQPKMTVYTLYFPYCVPIQAQSLHPFFAKNQLVFLKRRKA